MGFLLVTILVLICGIAAILFSILAWRLNNQTFFILGIIALGIYLIYFFVHFHWNIQLLLSGNAITILINLAFIGLPIFFLIKSQLKKEQNSFDGGEGGGPVTQEYLDEIINAPDEEIDFEDDLNLK
ncbi:MAG: hypothetical protein WDZ35_12650 [Crocinitomicaceae bacterium]